MLLFFATALFCASVGIASTTFTNLKDDRIIADWRSSTQKSTSLRTILAGKCSSHYDLVKDVHGSWPVERIQGGEGLLGRIGSHLRANCASSKACDPQTIFISDAESTPNSEIKEIMRSFTLDRYCVVSDAGNLRVDCSNVWFVFSTCVGERTIDEAAEPDRKSAEDYVLREVRFELRQRWPGLDLRNGDLKIITQTPSNSESALVMELTKAKQKREDSTRLSSEVVSSGQSSKRVRNNIDLTALEQGGFVGQQWAVQAVTNALQAVQNNLKNGGGPIVFLFLGPAGTGKSMLSRLVGSAYHGGEGITSLTSKNHFKFFNMAQYNSAEDVDSFLSPRAGLVGHGSIIDVFQHSQRPVVVLDEVEKAHTNLIRAMLLSWFDENGSVQDKKNASNTFPTKDAIFVLTSNCYSKEISQASQRFKGDARRVSNEILKLMETGAPTENAPGCKAFELEDVRRRMKAGHILAELEQYGFVTFLPPDESQVGKVVEWFLEDQRVHHEAVSKGKLYWTDGALNYFKRFASSAVSSSRGQGGMSEVNTALRSEIVRVMRTAAKNECFRTGGDTLLLVRKDSLVAHVFCPDSDHPNSRCAADDVSDICADSSLANEKNSLGKSASADYDKKWSDEKMELEFEQELEVIHDDSANEVEADKAREHQTHQDGLHEIQQEQQTWWNIAKETLLFLAISMAFCVLTYFAMSWFPILRVMLAASVVPALASLAALAISMTIYEYVLPESVKEFVRGLWASFSGMITAIPAMVSSYIHFLLQVVKVLAFIYVAYWAPFILTKLKQAYRAVHDAYLQVLVFGVSIWQRLGKRNGAQPPKDLNAGAMEPRIEGQSTEQQVIVSPPQASSNAVQIEVQQQSNGPSSISIRTERSVELRISPSQPSVGSSVQEVESEAEESEDREETSPSPHSPVTAESGAQAASPPPQMKENEGSVTDEKFSSAQTATMEDGTSQQSSAVDVDSTKTTDEESKDHDSTQDDSSSRSESKSEGIQTATVNEPKTEHPGLERTPEAAPGAMNAKLNVVEESK